MWGGGGEGERDGGREGETHRVREGEREGERESGWEGGRENEKACFEKKRKILHFIRVGQVSFLRKCISKNMTYK